MAVTASGDTPVAQQPDPADSSNTDSGAPSALSPEAIAAALGGGLLTPHTVNPELAAAERLYLKIWGVVPPGGYLKHLMAQGLNLYEIAAHEMSKPAFRYTRNYRDTYAQLAAAAAQTFGRR